MLCRAMYKKRNKERKREGKRDLQKKHEEEETIEKRCPAVNRCSEISP